MLKHLFLFLANSGREKLTDEEVVQEYLKSQNNYYFELFYNRYSSKIFGKCLTILKEKNLAQDATQDIMMKILLNLSKFGGRSKFSTWVYSITYNICIDFVRKRKKDLSFYVEDIHRYEGVVDDIDDKEILEVRLENLKIIMTQMPSGDQSILMMKYLDGMSIKEISSALSKTESAIKMKLKRAKHRFVKIHRENVVDTY
jgi:RNA polymerase sigma factor (sigma-70 family)